VRRAVACAEVGAGGTSPFASADGDQRPQSVQPTPERFVRWEEVLATCIASAIAALILSRLGVAGTIVGAALTPFIITVGGAVLARELARARQRIGATTSSLRRPAWRRLSLRPPRGRRLASALVTAALAFLITVAILSVMEALAGKPIDRWGHRGGSGYTFGDSSSSGSSRTTRTPAETGTTTRPSPGRPSPTTTAVRRPSPPATDTVTVTTTVPAPAVPPQPSTTPSDGPPSPTLTTPPPSP
jgi:hypothetical protein